MESCPECGSKVEQCSVTGDITCTECDWWIEPDELEEAEDD